MDVLVNLARKFGFKRLNNTLHLPIVFHCVPGAGKTSLILECIKADSRFVAVTAGVPSERNLEGISIGKFDGSVPGGSFPILDEYTLLERLPEGFFAVFGDPIQSLGGVIKPADFTCNVSRRIGQCTAQLLRSLNFDIVSQKEEDLVIIKDIYQVDPQDTVLYYEAEVGCLLKRHCVKAYNITEVTGQTFRSVTFVTGENRPEADRAKAYQCLTRHSSSLLILCPDASYAAA